VEVPSVELETRSMVRLKADLSDEDSSREAANVRHQMRFRHSNRESRQPPRRPARSPRLWFATCPI